MLLHFPMYCILHNVFNSKHIRKVLSNHFLLPLTYDIYLFCMYLGVILKYHRFLFIFLISKKYKIFNKYERKNKKLLHLYIRKYFSPLILNFQSLILVLKQKFKVP
jgi:hypothetical protein